MSLNVNIFVRICLLFSILIIKLDILLYIICFGTPIIRIYRHHTPIYPPSLCFLTKEKTVKIYTQDQIKTIPYLSDVVDLKSEHYQTDLNVKKFLKYKHLPNNFIFHSLKKTLIFFKALNF